VKRKVVAFPRVTTVSPPSSSFRRKISVAMHRKESASCGDQRPLAQKKSAHDQKENSAVVPVAHEGKKPKSSTESLSPGQKGGEKSLPPACERRKNGARVHRRRVTVPPRDVPILLQAPSGKERESISHAETGTEKRTGGAGRERENEETPSS